MERQPSSYEDEPVLGWFALWALVVACANAFLFGFSPEIGDYERRLLLQAVTIAVTVLVTLGLAVILWPRRRKY